MILTSIHAYYVYIHIHKYIKLIKFYEESKIELKYIIYKNW